MAVRSPAKFSSSEITWVLGYSLQRGNQNSQSKICSHGVYFLLGFCFLSVFECDKAQLHWVKLGSKLGSISLTVLLEYMAPKMTTFKIL